MLRLKPLNDSDITEIRNWPPYPGDMEQMDYALRQGGWLDECRSSPDTLLFAAEKGDDLVGFTILSRTGLADAEFRIAVRADRTGLGLGEGMTVRTLQVGFAEHGLSHIHLIVRKNNNRGISLYRRLGFVDQGECRKEIRGVPVDFWLMAISCEEFTRKYGE